MQAQNIAKYVLLALTLFMTMAINLSDNVISRLGFNPDYMLAALAANVITGMVLYHKLAILILVCLMSLGANMPEDFILNFGFDRDILTAALVVIVLIPFIKRHIID